MTTSFMDDVTFLQNTALGLMKLTQASMVDYHYHARKKVFECGKITLYHYQPKVKKPHGIPLLVVFATVNRPEILDIFPEQSFIGGLLDNGMDVYLLDWGYPDSNDQAITMSDYITHDLRLCIEHMIKASGLSRVNLLGICQGGLLCLCYSILFKTIHKLVLISTPIDFQTEDNVIGKIFRQWDVDAFTQLMGNVPGLWLTEFFISLRPFELVGKKYLRFIDHLQDDKWTEHFLRVEKWLYDAPDQTAASFKELIKECYQQNKLIKGQFKIDGKPVNLKKLTIPVLNVMASEDEIVPMSASLPLKYLAGSHEYAEKVFPSGHIGIYVSEKVGKSMPFEIAEWLKK